MICVPALHSCSLQPGGVNSCRPLKWNRKHIRKQIKYSQKEVEMSAYGTFIIAEQKCATCNFYQEARRFGMQANKPYYIYADSGETPCLANPSRMKWFCSVSATRARGIVAGRAKTPRYSAGRNGLECLAQQQERAESRETRVCNCSEQNGRRERSSSGRFSLSLR